MIAPGYGFDSSCVLSEAMQYFVLRIVPDQQLVVVAATRKLHAIRTPLDPAYLLPVPYQASEVMFRRSCIAMKDGSVSRPARKDPIVPCQRARSSRMSGHLSLALLCLGIVDTDKPARTSDCYLGAFLYPLYACYRFALFGKVAQPADRTVGS